jgi:hypothetical protein
VSSDREITASTVVLAVKEQVSSKLAEETVVLNLKDSVYYGLDAVGTTIWQTLQTPRTVGAIRDALCAEYDVDRGECEADLLALLASLAEHGLIEIRNESAD